MPARRKVGGVSTSAVWATVFAILVVVGVVVFVSAARRPTAPPAVGAPQEPGVQPETKVPEPREEPSADAASDVSAAKAGPAPAEDSPPAQQPAPPEEDEPTPRVPQPLLADARPAKPKSDTAAEHPVTLGPFRPRPAMALYLVRGRTHTRARVQAHGGGDDFVMLRAFDAAERLVHWQYIEPGLAAPIENPRDRRVDGLPPLEIAPWQRAGAVFLDGSFALVAYTRCASRAAAGSRRSARWRSTAASTRYASRPGSAGAP